DIALGIEIAGEEQLWRHAAARPAAIARWKLQRAEQPGETDMLLVRDRPLPHHAHDMPVHRTLHGAAQFFRWLRLEVRADDLAEEQGVELVDGNHDVPLAGFFFTARPPTPRCGAQSRIESRWL